MDFRKLLRMNWPMVLAVGTLLVMGILFVYSACYISEEQPVRALFKRQMVWAMAGIVCYLLFSLLDQRILRRSAWWLYGSSIFLLILVLFIGTRMYGARRWIMIFDMGIQPSEFAKLAMIIVLSRYLTRPDIRLDDWKSIFWVLLIVAIPVFLIMKEPDLGTAMVFVPTAFLMLFAAGAPLRYLGSFVLVGFVGVMILLGFLFLPEKMGVSEEKQEKIIRMVGLNPYQKDRIAVFFQADKDPLGAGWNKRQSEIAVGSGGLWGKGFRRGTQNILGFLPRSVAPTDFIYSVIAEEKGFFGSVIVLVLYTTVILSGLWTAAVTRDRGGRFVCVGIVSMLFSHVFINIAMTVGVMPITGLPLPLLSYGGSFMIVMMSSLGIMQNVYIHSRHEIIFE